MRTRSDTAVDLTLCRSALWEALALGFRRPTAETRARLASRDGASALADAAAVLDTAGETRLAPRARALAVEPAPSLDALALVHAALFGHTARGAVPPYETEYGEDSMWQPQREMADLGAFLHAFGLRLREDAHERPDHVACACEFLCVLARKEACALERGDVAMREATTEATRLFLRDHLGRWAPTLAAHLARLDPEGFYGALGGLLAEFVEAECRRAGTPSGPSFLRLRTAEPDEVPMACGPLTGASEACA